MRLVTIFFRVFFSIIIIVWIIYFFSTFPYEVKLFFGKVACYKVENNPENYNKTNKVRINVYSNNR